VIRSAPDSLAAPASDSDHRHSRAQLEDHAISRDEAARAREGLYSRQPGST